MLLNRYPRANGPSRRRYIEIKQVILFVTCAMSATWLGIGFCTLGIFMLFEPCLRISQAYFWFAWLLTGTLCQIVGLMGAFSERLHYILGHALICAVIIGRFTLLLTEEGSSVLAREALSAFAIFYISALTSLALAWDLLWERKKMMMVDSEGSEIKDPYFVEIGLEKENDGIMIA